MLNAINSEMHVAVLEPGKAKQENEEEVVMSSLSYLFTLSQESI